MKFIHLLLTNLIGQNVQAMVQVIYSPPILQPDRSEVTRHGTRKTCRSSMGNRGPLRTNQITVFVTSIF